MAASTGANSSRRCCEEYLQIAAAYLLDMSALIPELFVLFALLFLFQDQGIQFF
jgi:hypothetical protein